MFLIKDVIRVPATYKVLQYFLSMTLFKVYFVPSLFSNFLSMSFFTTNKKGGYPSIGSWSLSGLVGSYKITVRAVGLNIHFNNQEIKAVVTTYYGDTGVNLSISGLNSITNAQSISGIQVFERSDYGIKINYNTKCVAEYKDNILVIDPNYGSSTEWPVLVTAIFHGFKAEPTASMFKCNDWTATKCEPVGEISYIYKRNS